MSRVLVLSGPGLGLLGSREPEIYGTTTLAAVHAALQQRATGLGVEVRCEQRNGEGELIDLLESERGVADGCVINPGGLSHTSVALADALRAFARPVIEVHVSNIHAREAYRRTSLTAEAAVGVITGLGVDGYLLALEAMAARLQGGTLMEARR